MRVRALGRPYPVELKTADDAQLQEPMVVEPQTESNGHAEAVDADPVETTISSSSDPTVQNQESAISGDGEEEATDSPPQPILKRWKSADAGKHERLLVSMCIGTIRKFSTITGRVMNHSSGCGSSFYPFTLIPQHLIIFDEPWIMPEWVTLKWGRSLELLLDDEVGDITTDSPMPPPEGNKTRSFWFTILKT